MMFFLGFKQHWSTPTHKQPVKIGYKTRIFTILLDWSELSSFCISKTQTILQQHMLAISSFKITKKKQYKNKPLKNIINEMFLIWTQGLYSPALLLLYNNNKNRNIIKIEEWNQKTTHIYIKYLIIHYKQKRNTIHIPLTFNTLNKNSTIYLRQFLKNSQ